MRSLFTSALCLSVLCSLASGQCSTLTVSGSLNPGQTITISVTGATPDAPAFLVAGTDAGTTTIGTLTLGVAVPFIILPLGVTDSTGAVSVSVAVPADLPQDVIPNDTLVLQAVTLGFSIAVFPPVLDFCVSNTANLVSGTG